MSDSFVKQPDDISSRNSTQSASGESSFLPIAIVVDQVRTSVPEVHGIFSGYQWYFLCSKLRRAGINPESCQILTLNEVSSLKPASLIVGFGEDTLRYFTDKRGIDKWQMSPLLTHSGQKFIPTFDLARMNVQYELGLYLELALRRAAAECRTPTYEQQAPERFRLNPDITETFAVLDHIAANESEISVDVETGYGQINTVGFAWSPSDAIAINVLPDRLSDETYFELWRRIAAVLRSPSRKIFQNFIYDVSYFSAYGIQVENIAHDTMWAMKFLYPELDMNLGNVGRIYTQRSYWKDDGKVEHEEGKKKDWGNIRDWHRHYLYNCRDTTGTWEAKQNQLRDIEARGLGRTWNDYVMQLAPAVLEMCSNGMPLCEKTRESIRAQTEARVQALTLELHKEVGSEINPGSWQQKLKYLKGQGVAVPKKYDKARRAYRESTDATSLQKIALKHPELRAVPLFIDIAGLQKALSSYINFDVKPGDARVRYSLGKFTETFRFAGGTDPWGRGFNIQTIPREGGEVSIKSMFVAPEGMSFVEVDLRQAESRFVAYDANEKTLIDMLESGADVHSYVADGIIKTLGKDVTQMPKEEYKKTWRQLGKKSGHGFNYAMKAGVFVDTVFAEMGMILPKSDAEAIRETYYNLFPGIPLWHEWIRNELDRTRELKTPFGWERSFYGRLNDDMFKEAYAFRPQSTIPYITNQLMLHLMQVRRAGELEFELLLQGHDSLYALMPEARAEDYMRECHALEKWQAGFNLPGGKLIIPVETKFGKVVADLEEWEP